MRRLHSILFACLLFSLPPAAVYSQWMQTDGPYGGYRNPVSSLAASGTNVYAGIYGGEYMGLPPGGVALSTDNGQTWTGVGLGWNVTAIAVNSDEAGGVSVYAGIRVIGLGARGEIYRTTNNGASWTQIDTGLFRPPISNALVVSPAISGAGVTYVFAGTQSGILLTSNNGTSWTATLDSVPVSSLAISDTNVFAGTENGVYRSTNNGTSWTQLNAGLADTNVLALAVSGTNIFAGTYSGGVFLSVDNGTNWIQRNLDSLSVYALATTGTDLFAGTSSGVFHSTDNGATWTVFNAGFTEVTAFEVSGANIVAGTYDGVFLSSNGGTSWTRGLSKEVSIPALAVSGTSILAGTESDGIFLSTNDGANWNQSNLVHARISSFAVSNTFLLAGTERSINGVPSDTGIFRSTDNGLTWIGAGLTDWNVTAVAVSGTTFVAGTWDPVDPVGGVLRSTDYGTSWNEVGLNTYIGALALYPASGGAGVTNLFAGTWGSGVFLSTNDGTDWTAARDGLASTSVRAFGASGRNLFAGTSSGVYLSTNDGTSWTWANAGLPGWVKTFAVYGTNLFAGTAAGVFRSTNNGMSWETVGLTDTSVYSLAVLGTSLFAGTSGAGVWRRPLSEVTSVERFSTDLPTHFSLDQNYPNPFNPRTEIRYQMSEVSKVSLKVFDILGRVVATLVDEEQPAGVYRAEWNAAVSSGVYFYRLEAVGKNGKMFVETKKMMLVR